MEGGGQGGTHEELVISVGGWEPLRLLVDNGRIVLQVRPHTRCIGIALAVFYMHTHTPALASRIRIPGGKWDRIVLCNKLLRRSYAHALVQIGGLLNREHLPLGSHPPPRAGDFFHFQVAHALVRPSVPVREAHCRTQETVQLRQGLSTNIHWMLVSGNGWSGRARRMWHKRCLICQRRTRNGSF